MEIIGEAFCGGGGRGVITDVGTMTAMSRDLATAMTSAADRYYCHSGDNGGRNNSRRGDLTIETVGSMTNTTRVGGEGGGRVGLVGSTVIERSFKDIKRDWPSAPDSSRRGRRRRGGEREIRQEQYLHVGGRREVWRGRK